MMAMASPVEAPGAGTAVTVAERNWL